MLGFIELALDCSQLASGAVAGDQIDAGVRFASTELVKMSV